MRTLIYLIIGFLFGFVMIKSEAASWFRIYEMFQFDSFHMYGIIGSALMIGILVVQAIKRLRIKDIHGELISFQNKNLSISRYLLGGILFGLGWALAGACPGPMFALLGSGFISIILVILGAILGTWLYGILKDKLPH